MTQTSFDDILQAIDRSECEPSSIDDAKTESFCDEMDEEQEVGVFVRDQEGWVDIDRHAHRKIVFRFKWRKRSNTIKQPANSSSI